MRVQIRFVTTFVLTILLMFSSVSFALAVPDEGMFMLDQVGGLPIASRGAKIKAADIYNPAGGGLSDAIVRVNIGAGGFGTGEFISANGLVLTNHHVGFDALVEASTPEKDYAKNGYASSSMATELPAKDYTVLITQRIENVTAKILGEIPANASEADRRAAIAKNATDLEKAEQAKAPAGATVRVQALNNGYFYYLFQTIELKDVRVVYAPPKNIGFFGGDPDNFEWTRHCGDFTFLRAYVAPDGSAAPYSVNNVPYKPKRFLNVSLGGVKDNEFTMVMGYPGGTTRYRESRSVAYNQNVRMPLLVRYFQASIKSLEAEGAQDPDKKIKLQSDIFSLANSEKAFDGGVIAIRHASLLERKQAEEKRFETWVNSDPARKAKYGEVISAFARLYDDFDKNSQKNLVVNLMSTSTPVFKFVSDAVKAVNGSKTLSADETAKLKEELAAAFKDRNAISEGELVKYFLREANDLPAGQKIAPIETLFGGKQGRERVRAEEDLARAVTQITADDIAAIYTTNKDFIRTPLAELSVGVMGEFPQAQARGAKLNGEVGKWRELFLHGWSEMNIKKPYPDANATLRFSYGNIKGYNPKESVTYTPFTTLAGIMEKDTGMEPFDVPQKLKDLFHNKDFGRYGGLGSVPVNFLTTNDIIGGNSGSPVLNGKGEQVGLVFDGNYEGLGNDFFYNDAVGRMIAVDIRYVFFVTEKFGGANWFFSEVNFVDAPKVSTAKK